MSHNIVLNERPVVHVASIAIISQNMGSLHHLVMIFWRVELAGLR